MKFPNSCDFYNYCLISLKIHHWSLNVGITPCKISWIVIGEFQNCAQLKFDSSSGFFLLASFTKTWAKIGLYRYFAKSFAILDYAWHGMAIPSTCLNGSINVTKNCGITPALFNTLLEWVINGFYMHTGHSKFAMFEIPWWWWFAINRDLTFWGRGERG